MDSHNEKSDSLNLFGKELNIPEIVNRDTFYLNNNGFIVLYFSAYDCYSCIERSLQLIQRFQRKELKFIVILSDGSIGEFRRNHTYPGFIFIDREYHLNRQLNYTSTPVFISVGPDNVIRDTYHPGIGFDDQGKVFELFVNDFK